MRLLDFLLSFDGDTLRVSLLAFLVVWRLSYLALVADQNERPRAATRGQEGT